MKTKALTLLIIVVVFSTTMTWIDEIPGRVVAADSSEVNSSQATGWQIVSSPTTRLLSGVDIVSEIEVWAVGGHYWLEQLPTVLHYAGADWEVASEANFSSSHLNSVSLSDPNNGWAVGYQMVSQYKNGTWTHEEDMMDFPHAVEMTSDTSGWMVGFRYQWSGGLQHYGLIREYKDDSWVEVCDRMKETYLDISMVDASEGWIVGRDDSQEAVILHRSDASGGWVEVASPITEALYSVVAVSPTEGWAVGDAGTILHYTGGTWQTMDSPVDTDLRAVAMVSPYEGWIVGKEGTILHYMNSVWQVANSPTTENLNDIDVLPSGEAWAVGDNGTILHYVEPPTAAFTAVPTAGLNPLEVQFTDISTGKVTSSVWSLGDGTTIENTQTLTHTYTSSGRFISRLIVSNAGGSSTMQKTITVGEWGTDTLASGEEFTRTFAVAGVYPFMDPTTGNNGEIRVNMGTLILPYSVSSMNTIAPMVTITITADGFVPSSVQVQIPVSVTVRWVVDQGDTGTYGVIGYGPVQRIFLPLIIRNP